MGSLSLTVGTWRRVEATRSRKSKILALSETLRSLPQHEVELAVGYLAGEPAQGRFGIGARLLQQVAATEPAAEATLSLTDVDEQLTRLAAVRGAGQGRLRAQILTDLLSQADLDEQAFLLRLLAGELRAGALVGLMLEAIAAAAQVDAASVRRAAMYAPHLGALARVALIEGASGLAGFALQTLHPFSPMLAQTGLGVADALTRLGGRAAFEWKLDGARILVHRHNEQIRVYTRHLNDVAASLPDILEQVRALPASEFILDGEAIALDSAGRPRPFQVTMRRFGRKLDVAALQKTVPLHAYFFDCLRLQQDSLADQPTQARFAALERFVPQAQRVPRLITADIAEAQHFYEEAVAAGHEGLMAKALDAPYEAGNRGAGWLKLKRAHTLDLVVLAAEWGHGRRTGTLSNLHLGARDGANFIMLGKTFKGLTDALLAWQTRELLTRELRQEEAVVYVRPELVVEVAFNDIQASPQYPAGLALRFARVRRYREDKSAAEADTIEIVRQLYARQSGAV